jgi:hypothetical protein
MKKTCKLCRKKVDKLVDSHIYPLSFYREFKMEPSQQKSYSVESGSYPKRSPNGRYDQIVCHDCEEIFGPWDTYAIELYRFIPPVTAVIDSLKTPQGKKRVDYAEVEIIDYPKLKLFVLSMLWRSHASKLKDFGTVKLGHYEKEIREMILKNEPGTAEDFPFYIDKYKMPPSLRGITSPNKLKFSGVTTFYRFNLLDLEIYIKVSNQPFPEQLFSRIVRPGNPLRMKLVDFHGSPLDEAFARTMKNVKNVEMMELQNRKNKFMEFKKNNPEK